MNTLTELQFDLGYLVKFVIHNAVVHCQCFGHREKYDSTPDSALSIAHTETFSKVLLLGAFFPDTPTVNMLNYKFDCKHLSEKYISTQRYLTTKSKLFSYLYFKM